MASSGLRERSSSERYSIFFAFGPRGPPAFLFSACGAPLLLLLGPASAMDASGCADGLAPALPPRSVAAGSLPPALAAAPPRSVAAPGFAAAAVFLLPRGVALLLLLLLLLAPARGVLDPPAFLGAPPSGLLRGDAARGDLPLFLLVVFPVRSVSAVPDTEPAAAAVFSAGAFGGICSRFEWTPQGSHRDPICRQHKSVPSAPLKSR